MIKLVFITLFLPVVLSAEVVKSFPKEYYEIKDIKLQKKRFVEILYPLILKEEKKIEQERAFVKAFFSHFAGKENINKEALKRLEELARKYRIKSLFDKDEYLKKIDTIPVSLVLAQAAVESNWGKSRFAKEANNLFGEWTWGEKGIIPKNRPEGESYKIRIFNSLDESISSYMRNLNRHWAYEEFREARYMSRKNGEQFTGFKSAAFLIMYSQLREKYTQILKETIVQNEWELLDEEIREPLDKRAEETAMLEKAAQKEAVIDF